MAAFSSMLLAGSLGLGVAGAGMQFYGLQQQRKAQEGVVNAQVAAEKTRQQAMQLDSQRRQRESIRQGIVARGMAVNESANEGAQYGSGLPGITGQISNQTQWNVLGARQNENLAKDLSSDNMGALRSGQKASDAASFAAMGGGLTSLGGSIMNSIGSINRLGTYFGGNSNG